MTGMFWSEARGALTLAVVAAAVVMLFLTLLDRTGATVDLMALTTTTTTSTTTTTIDPRDDLRPVTDMCAAAAEFITSADSTLFVWPGKVPQLAETFYATAYASARGDIRPEFAAALAYYEEFNEIADPGRYDPLTLLRGPTADRYQQLATREPPGVEATRANVAFLCGGVQIPGPPTLSADEFEDLQEIIAEELADEEL